MPRRSFPLVVPPPGGFEDAVRRGRGMRRRRASGGSAAALVLVGALGYSMLGSAGVARLNETRNPKVSASPTPGVGGVITPAPQVSASAGTGSDGGSVAIGPPGTVPTVSTSPVGTRPTRRPGAAVRYATRPVLHEEAAQTNASSYCLTSTSNGWCSYVNVIETRADAEGVYTFEYYVCRTVDAGSDGTLTWDRRLHADFVALDVAHNDPVFTYSRAIPVVHESAGADVPMGTCMRWWTEWDGYDDYGLNPPPGQYRLIASSFAKELPPNNSDDFTHR